MVQTKIIIEDYNPEWNLIFHQLKAVFQSYLDNLFSDIQHVGSTSVPGLAAKPVIDIDIIIHDKNALQPIIEKLTLLGYEHVGQMGITDREAFKCTFEKTPLDNSNRTWPKHNLYVCPKDSISLKNHLALRDFLRKNPVKAKEYGELKKRLATEHPYNIDLYIEGKTPFIVAILKEVGFDNETLESIAKENSVAQ